MNGPGAEDIEGAAQYYSDNRAGIIRYIITAARARQIHDQHRGDNHFTGDLRRGFEYWIGAGSIERLVPVCVTPVAGARVPQDAKDRLAAGEQKVIAEQWD